MTKNELSARLDAFEAALAAYGVHKFTAKEIWELRAEIAEEFRSVEFADPGERKDAWQRLQDGMDMLRQKSALLQVENEAFATEAEERIEALQRRVDDADPEKDWTRDELASLRDAANDIFEFMRQNRWPSRERRTAVWDRFTAGRDRIKAMEDALFAQLRAAIQQRQERSAQFAAPLKSLLQAVRPQQPFEQLAGALASWRALLAERAIATTFVDAAEKAVADGSASKAPLKLKSDLLRDARRLFTEQRSQLSREDGQDVYALITLAQKEMDAAWAAYKDDRQKKADEWKEKQKAFTDMLREKMEKRKADAINLEKIIAAKVDFAPKLEQRLLNQQDYLNKLFDDLDELQAKLESARNFDMRERMEAAIESKKQRISEVDADMKSVQQRIDVNQKDIEEIRVKITKIAEGVAEMQQKLEEVARKADRAPR
ncbi:MAG: hypothetical protein EOO08_06250 [Chitinophagaceae bacterium]|nr:MAG: hypothetical protein EOO08_06250 [Chitinophagaceae bacterium]